MLLRLQRPASMGVAQILVYRGPEWHSGFCFMCCHAHANKKNAIDALGILFIQGLQNTLQKVSENIDVLMRAEVIHNLKGFLIIFQSIHCTQ